MFEIKTIALKRPSSGSKNYPKLSSVCDITLEAMNDANDGTSDDSFLFGSPTNTRCQVTLDCLAGYYGAVLEESIRNMKAGEKNSCYVTFTQVDEGKPTSLGFFTLELHFFTGGKELYEVPVHDRIEMADRWRESGNNFFSSGEICMAGYWYSRALQALLSCVMENFVVDEKKTLEGSICKCRINLAAVQLKRSLFQRAQENCSRALVINPCILKALYRRAQAYAASGQINEAIEDLKLALKIQPNSSALRNLLAKLNGTAKLPIHT